jgi:CRP-like cAMP-binding protein
MRVSLARITSALNEGAQLGRTKWKGPKRKSDEVELPAASDPTIRNEILLSLPHKEYNQVFRRLEFIPLPTATVLHRPCEIIKFAYFINSGLASILIVMADGKSVEVGLTGKEGFVGLPLIVALKTGPTLVNMQVQGSGYRVDAKDFVELLGVCPALRNSLQRYSQQLAMQAAQVAACNRIHEVDQRLARWLLMSQDRLGGNLIPLTQEFLAHMLGTRRASVTEAAGRLQKTGMITYRRGQVLVENRDKLEAAACECYGAMIRQSRSWQGETK